MSESPLPPLSPKSSRLALLLVLATVFVPYVVRYLEMTPPWYVPDGDGFYMWLYARSLAFDHDIDFTNDYALCGDRWHVGRDLGTGHPPNPWYIGPSLFWTPAIVVLRHVLDLSDAPLPVQLGCSGIIPRTVGLLAPVFTVITLAIARRIALRFASERAVLVAMLVVAFGSPLLVYGSWVWSYAHVWGAFTLTAGIAFALRAYERRESTLDYVLSGLFIGWASLNRPHHAIFILTPFVLTLGSMADTIRRERRLPVGPALRGLAALAAFLAMSSIRLWAQDYMYGSPWPSTLRGVYLQPAHAHPLLLLFSNRTGFFAHTPLMWLAAIGLAFFLRVRAERLFVAAIVLPFVIDLWVCASPLMWTGSAAIGARLLTSFAGLFVVWSAMTLDRIFGFLLADPKRLQRFALGATLVPALVVAWNMDDPTESKETARIYGGTFTRIFAKVDAAIGNPFTFPAPLVFALRYRVSPSAFGAVADYGFFGHDVDRGHLTAPDRLELVQETPEAVYSAAWTRTAHGRLLAPGREARIVYALAWPFVTSLEVKLVRPPGRAGCRLRVENHLFVRGRSLGSRALAADATTAVFDAPEGAFDSGIDETRFLSNCPLEIQSIRWVDANAPTLVPVLRPGVPRAPGR